MKFMFRQKSSTKKALPKRQSAHEITLKNINAIIVKGSQQLMNYSPVRLIYELAFCTILSNYRSSLNNYFKVVLLKNRDFIIRDQSSSRQIIIQLQGYSKYFNQTLLGQQSFLSNLKHSNTKYFFIKNSYNYKRIMEADKPKTLIIMRGLPGSGKSTKAKALAGEQGLVFSTDDFFMVNGKYQYDAKMIVEYHMKNLQRSVKAIQQGKPLIIIDNTNIKLWEMKKYVIAGQENGYTVKIEEADSPWAFNARQCAKKNSHGVPQDTIKNMLSNYETFNNLQEIKAAQMKKRNAMK